MNIPAGQTDVVHAWALEPTSVADQLTGGLFQKDEPLTVHSVALHMHTLGTSTRMDIQRGSGERECLLDIPRWDFHWQAAYQLEQSRRSVLPAGARVPRPLQHPGERPLLGATLEQPGDVGPAVGT
ncbi:hypothetical protein JQX13_16125 [Archangium violaceum]|uniref:hypothetical protein n=1 Tax=Archangium violaceum TaxID=83451 RepID=UPI00193AF89E|nr:hypothetical protein [Archangium violaceum]QRK11461.1 hypothetical protein JQX13_16125 [Archangium violaceum]